MQVASQKQCFGSTIEQLSSTLLSIIGATDDISGSGVAAPTGFVTVAIVVLIFVLWLVMITFHI